MATINYWGLSGVKDSVTVALTITIDQLISAIATDEGLATDYYKISVLNNPAINDTTYGDSSSTLTAIGIVDGDTILCTPNQHGTKEARQLQKLTIAAKARANDSNARSVYDISELPAKYSGNDVYDNLNEGGLVTGRPWATDETPNSIAGLRFWLDTATTSTLNGGTYTDGDALTSWTERKQNAAFAVQAANRRPTIQSGAGDLKNGYPVVRFTNPAGDWDQAEWTSVSGFANATGYTMVCLVKFAVNANATSDFILRIRNFDGTYSAGIYYNTVSGRWEMTAPTGGVYVDNTVDPDDTWKIVSVRYDSTQSVAANRYTFRWAKTARTVTSLATPPSGALAATAGNNFLLGYFSVADWAEMMVYNTALSDAQIIALEDYLSSKWGV